MADITTKTFADLNQGQVAAVQARAAGIVDFSEGSILLAFVEAVSAVALFLQALVLQVLGISRASTATGADLDSFVADYGGPFVDGGASLISRLAAVPAEGDLTFSRFTPSGQVILPVGSTAATQDGSQSFVVLLDTANPAYNADLGGYVLADTVAAVTVPAMAITAGAGGNVVAGQVNTINSAIPGIDAVTNAANFFGGADQESDAALRLRFRAFILALREATPAAIEYWVKSLGPAVTAQVVEFEDQDGTPHLGYFYVVVDDGSGAPDSDFLAAANYQVDAHRAAGIEFDVFAVDLVTVDIAAAITTAVAADDDDVNLVVHDALEAYVGSLALGEPLIYNRLFQVIYDASPLVETVTGLTVNGSTSNVSVDAGQVVKPGTVTVT